MACVEEIQTATWQRPPAHRSISAMRKCASTPTLRSLGEPLNEDGMEVYVVLRNFQEFAGGMFNRLPGPLRTGVRDCGICHYMTVFRQPDGSLVQFDFGPSAGGDIHVPLGPFSRLLNKAPRGSRPSGRIVEGQVREHKLTALPDNYLYVGRTNLSMADIRAWNSIHASTTYELHKSDCRHYVNSLVQYTTGVERATVSALRHQWANNRQSYGLAECVVRLGHFMTDVANWEKVKAMGHATTAVIMAMTGQQALAKLKATPLLQTMQRRLLPVARKALVPVPRAITSSLTQRPAVAVGATAVATYAASGGQAPGAVRDTLTLGARVAGGVQKAMRAAVSLAEQVGRSASAATQQTTSHAVALATGIAGAASRGATSIIVARPARAPVAVEAATAVVATNRGSPLRAILPNMKGRRTQQLALVASKR